LEHWPLLTLKASPQYYLEVVAKLLRELHGRRNDSIGFVQSVLVSRLAVHDRQLLSGKVEDTNGGRCPFDSMAGFCSLSGQDNADLGL
jgi:hypothetical protein